MKDRGKALYDSLLVLSHSVAEDVDLYNAGYIFLGVTESPEIHVWVKNEN